MKQGITRRSFVRTTGIAAGLILLLGLIGAYADDRVNHDLSAKTAVAFKESIRPVMEAACFECHGPEKEKSGIRFDTFNPSSFSEFDLENLTHARDVLNFEEMPPEEADRPSLELLEFLGDWETDDGEWVDPEELEQIAITDQEQEYEDEPQK